MIFQEPISYYVQRITSQYQMSVNYKSWIVGLLQPLIDLTNCLYSFYFVFDLDLAVGDQLDILGDIIGAERVVPFKPTNPNDSSTLDDATYRILLKATLGANFWNGTNGELQTLWQQLFPGGSISIYDHQDMSFTVAMAGTFTSIIQDMITHDMIVPRPEGVLVNYTFAGLPLFGCDLSNTYVAGVDLGHVT